MKENKCAKMVFSSSATVYGQKIGGGQINETTPLNPTNPYGMIKLNIEDMLRFFSIKFPNFQSIILRYFNPVGAHHSGLIGDGSKIANNLIPIIVKVANKEIIELNIFGNDYDTCDGTCVRDFVHVMDVAEGHVACLNHFKENTGLSIFNLGTGKGHSVLQILNEFIKVNKVEVPWYHDISTWKGYAGCIASDKKLTKPQELKYNEWNTIRSDWDRSEGEGSDDRNED